MISPECWRIYLTPYRILGYEVALASVKPDKIQEINFGESSEILKIRKFSDYYSEYYVLVKGNMSGNTFVIGEIYKFYTSLIDGDISLNLIEILKKLFEKVGVEFDFSGIKTKFLYKSQILIGLPPLEEKIHRELLVNYLSLYFDKDEMGHSQDESVNIFAIPRITKGNYVDFMHFDLLYGLNHFKYDRYLKERH
jgi:hypothetical protein